MVLCTIFHHKRKTGCHFDTKKAASRMASPTCAAGVPFRGERYRILSCGLLELWKCAAFAILRGFRRKPTRILVFRASPLRSTCNESLSRFLLKRAKFFLYSVDAGDTEVVVIVSKNLLQYFVG